MPAIVADRELALVGGDLRVQHHLEKNVAELLSKPGDVIGLYGVDRLVGLFHHVLRDRLVGLSPGPTGTLRESEAWL